MLLLRIIIHLSFDLVDVVLHPPVIIVGSAHFVLCWFIKPHCIIYFTHCGYHVNILSPRMVITTIQRFHLSNLANQHSSMCTFDI
jgi:hypothetical protein